MRWKLCVVALSIITIVGRTAAAEQEAAPAQSTAAQRDQTSKPVDRLDLELEYIRAASSATAGRAPIGNEAARLDGALKELRLREHRARHVYLPIRGASDPERAGAGCRRGAAGRGRHGRGATQDQRDHRLKE